MGNQQSNERKPNYKICKITSISRHSGWIRCYLDDYVPYSNGSYDYMDFETNTSLTVFEGVAGGLFNYNGPSQATLIEGWHIAINTDTTREHSSNHSFSRRSVINVNVASSDFASGGFEEWVDSMEQMREMRARANEWADVAKQEQRGWQLQPPKK